VTGLPAELVARAGTSYDDVRIFPDAVLWLEGRADGRDVLVRWTRARGRQDVTPDGFSVASYAHEYGGGAWAASGDTVWFCNADGQRLYRVSGSSAVPVDPDPPRPGAVRYADLCIDPGGRHLWSVRERHEPGGVFNELVRIPAGAAAVPRTIASGWDFYAFPRPSPDGRRLAWTCWNAPLMPWDGACLYVAGINPDGSIGKPVPVAGNPEESVFQPQWSPDGILHFVSDRSGWWNLYAWRDGEVVPVMVCDAELGVAQWEFGYSTYAFLDAGRVAVIVQRGTRQSLEVSGQGQVDLPYTSIKPYLSAHGSKVVVIASSAAETPSIVVIDIDNGTISKIAGAEPIADRESLSDPEPFVFTARDGVPVHGLFYLPWDYADIPPPLVIKAHPGPTANVPMRLDWHTQYLCSHGFAVAEIDYRGSTGYGRAFRNALRGQWGEGDALDCADGAAHLATQGRTDPRRTAIWGASAGGYTALRALIRTQAFAACIARSPVIDPRTWTKTAPKFQASQADHLIGPWPDAALTYQARSVLDNAKAISCPVLLLHGEQDQVTPVSESRALAKAIGDRARLIVFPDQGHNLRSPQAQRQALELELGFLRAVAPAR
jgi:dipeptidyl aminopeptidase/acylaminoacyl peptidase